MSTFTLKLLNDTQLTVPKAIVAFLDKQGISKRHPKDDPYLACESASLRLSKYVRIGDAQVLRISKQKNGKIEEKQMERPSKADEISCIMRVYGNGFQLFGSEPSKLPFLHPKGCISFFAKLEANLAINLAGGILENASISLHRNFNTVRLPGSALKGITSTYAVREWRKLMEQGKSESARQVAKQMSRIFGFPTQHQSVDAILTAEGITESSGKISFMDAYPEGNSTLVEEILTCHHREYYQDEDSCAQALDNEQKINPVPFLALREGVEFEFTLAPLRGAIEDDLQTAKNWLIGALTILGIGAKTAAGYGWFSYDEKASNEKSLKRENAEKERIQKQQEHARKAEEDAKKRSIAEAKALREKKLSELPAEERLKIWVLEDWKRQTFRREAFLKRTKDEQFAIIRLMINDDAVKQCWLEIKQKAESKKKKEREQFLPLHDLLRQLVKANKAEVGGKLP